MDEAAILYEQYLDSRLVKEKREILNKLMRKGLLTEKMINDFAVTMDLTVSGDSLEDRYYDLLNCLDSIAKFETTGLR